jgi:hypothetical protein
MVGLPPQISRYVSTRTAVRHWGNFAFPAAVHENELCRENAIK